MKIYKLVNGTTTYLVPSSNVNYKEGARRVEFPSLGKLNSSKTKVLNSDEDITFVNSYDKDDITVNVVSISGKPVGSEIVIPISTILFVESNSERASTSVYVSNKDYSDVKHIRLDESETLSGLIIKLTGTPVSGGGGYIEVTKSQADALITSSGLSKGALYKITDRGDRGIILMATDVNKLAKHGKRIMLHPNPDIPIWADDDTTITSASLRVRGGKVFFNESGNIGTATSYHELDEFDWVEVPKASFSNDEYIEVEFEIAYDYENDWVEMQRDKKNNVATSPFGLVTDMGFSEWNPVDATDWLRAPMINNEFTICCNNPYAQFISSNECFIIMDNKCALIANNVVKNPYGLGSIKNNMLIDGNTSEFTGAIVNNECTLIEDNYLIGQDVAISFNRVDGEIKTNNCDGSILPEEEFPRHANISRNEAANIKNNNTRIISMNYIKGDIDGNNVGGSLSLNSGKKIINNTCAGTNGNVIYNQVDIIENNTCTGIGRNIGTIIKDNNIGGGIADCECYSIGACQNTGNILRVESNYYQGNDVGFPYAVPNTVADLQNIDHEKVSFTKEFIGQPLVVGTPVVIGYLPKVNCRVLALRIYGNLLTSSTDSAELLVKTGSDTLASELITSLNSSGFDYAMIPVNSTVDWQPVTIEALVEDIDGGQIVIDFEYSKMYTPL